jgi:hypothetical protein
VVVALAMYNSLVLPLVRSRRVVRCKFVNKVFDFWTGLCVLVHYLCYSCFTSVAVVLMRVA